jgi:hypothetical protein
MSAAVHAGSNTLTIWPPTFRVDTRSHVSLTPSGASRVTRRNVTDGKSPMTLKLRKASGPGEPAKSSGGS